MKITPVATDSHEEVLRVSDAASGLTGFIAVHSTRLGPAAGGLRMRPYADESQALTDVLRLSAGMTCKNAAAGLPLGGGKAVILGDPATGKSPELLAAMGRAVDSLEGRYWTAEDMGMTPDDMRGVAAATRYVAGLPEGPHASGDPSPVTARGVFAAMRTTARHRFGSADLAGRRVAVQGLGHVGWHLCRLLHQAGAELTVADVDADTTARAAAEFGARVAATGEILFADVDILAPCAIGAVLNAETIPRIMAGAITGAANNQLATDADALRLQAHGILYAPDYVANAGGIINVATEVLRIGDRAAFVEEKLAALADTLDAILSRAAREGLSPHDVAQSTVDQKMRARAA